MLNELPNKGSWVGNTIMTLKNKFTRMGFGTLKLLIISVMFQKGSFNIIQVYDLLSFKFFI